MRATFIWPGSDLPPTSELGDADKAAQIATANKIIRLIRSSLCLEKQSVTIRAFGQTFLKYHLMAGLPCTTTV